MSEHTQKNIGYEAQDWRKYSYMELISQYSPQEQVGKKMESMSEQTLLREAEFRLNHDFLCDISYGPSPDEKLDLIVPNGVIDPYLHIFIHGGYWMRGDKMGHAQCNRAFIKKGYAVAVLNFGHCPESSIEDLITQVRNAIIFLWRQAGTFGYKHSEFNIVGHSTGAHLAAMLLVSDLRSFAPEIPSDLIHSVALISGLYDLTPISKIPQGNILGLDDKDLIQRLSPVLYEPFNTDRIKLLVAIGIFESDEFKRQSKQLADAWGEKFSVCQIVTIEDRNHIDILQDLQCGVLAELVLDNAS